MHYVVLIIYIITNILFSTQGACYRVDNIGRLTTKLDGCPRRWLRDLCGGYHFAGFASCFAARLCLPKWFIITHVWFELGMYKKIPQTLRQQNTWNWYIYIDPSACMRKRAYFHRLWYFMQNGAFYTWYLKVSLFVPRLFEEKRAQQAHDVYTTSAQRRCNVMTLHRRWGDVVLTSCACWEGT